MASKPGPSTLAESDRRVLARWAADCAALTLELFEREAPDDRRPRTAISGARLFAGGELTVGIARRLAADAHAAARSVETPSAVAAARAAGHAVATAHMAAHALGASAYAALAAHADVGSPDVGRFAIEHADDEVREILRRLPLRPASNGRVGRVLHDLDRAFRDQSDTRSC